jgi:hypothetical protein
VVSKFQIFLASVSADGVPITSAEKLKLFSPGGGFLLYLYGELTYSDILGTGKTYHSKFCGRYNPTTNTFDSCEKHNQVN